MASGRISAGKRTFTRNCFTCAKMPKRCAIGPAIPAAQTILQQMRAKLDRLTGGPLLREALQSLMNRSCEIGQDSFFRWLAKGSTWHNP